jgi:gamma-glutamyltranspeptidase/glutathione hydrolase
MLRMGFGPTRSACAVGAVATGHPLVTAAAVRVLERGGNAFDAAVAAGFASAVAEPVLTSLGGGGFLLVRTAGGEERLFDFFVDTPGRGLSGKALDPHFFPITVHFPGSDQDFNIGLGSVAVPGNLKGYLHVHRRLGRLPLQTVLEPAIDLARDGAKLNAHQAYLIELLRPMLTLGEAGRALYAPSGHVLTDGANVVNPDLARFLESLPDGAADDFYSGTIARRVARDMENGQGLVTAEDLAAYRVIEREPLAVEYRGYRVLTNPPPAFGGSLVALSLTLLGRQDLGSARFASAAHLRSLVAVMVEVDQLRERECLSVDGLSEDELFRSVERVRASSSGGTTHVSIADADGNVASMTTSNGEGSGYIVPGTGILLNNMMGEDDLHPAGFHASPPGERVASMMSPSAVLGPAGVRLVVGSGGSKRIRTALLQVIDAVVRWDVSVRDAVEAPRVHWDGSFVQMEPGFADTAIAGVRDRWPMNVWPERNLYFGGVHAVSPAGNSRDHCAGDPRRGGSAAIVPGTPA